MKSEESSSDGEVSIISFYRLRFELSTTSSDTAVTLENISKVLTARQVGTLNNPDHAGVTMRGLWVRSTGESVGVIGDYAITPEAISEPFQCLLEKRADGESTVRVYNIPERGDLELLKEISHGGSDSLLFSVDLSQLEDTSPFQMDLPCFEGEKILGTRYYPWYTMESWDSAWLYERDKPATPYSSSDPVAIERHVHQAQNAGIDVFLCYWKNPGGYNDRNFALLLDIAQNNNFYVAIQLQAVEFDQATWEAIPRDETVLLSELEYIHGNYGGYPAYLKVDGKPVVFVYSATSVPLSTWENIFSQLEVQGYHGFYLADYGGGQNPKLQLLEVFDGFYLYNVLGIIHSSNDVSDLVDAYGTTGRGVRYYPLLMDSPTLKIWMPTVEPGYNDSAIEGRTSPTLDRKDGDFYRDTFNAALDSDPDWIGITTWNEWWEQSHIEPSQWYNDQYLRITQRFAKEWKENIKVTITKPETGHFYIANKKVLSTEITIIIGKITVAVNAYSSKEIDKVEFYIDNVLKNTDYNESYQWLWNEFAIGEHEIKVIAYDKKGNKAEDKINVMIFNFGG